MNRKVILDSNCILKNIFEKEENIDILKDFIESILNIKISKINQRDDLRDKEIFGEYLGFANVTIVTDTNTKLNIGIQIIDGLYIQDKMFLHYSQTYSDIIKTVTINILDCEYFEEANYHTTMKVKDRIYDKNEQKLYKGEGEIHVLELPKFTDTVIYNKEKAWISYLKQSNLDEEIEEKYEKIKKLDDCLNKYWENEEL